MKVLSPQKSVIEIDGVSGQRYRASDGYYEMSERDARAAVKYGGSWPNLISGRSNDSYRCSCGFAPYFSPCSRCGRSREN